MGNGERRRQLLYPSVMWISPAKAGSRKEDRRDPGSPHARAAEAQTGTFRHAAKRVLDHRIMCGDYAEAQYAVAGGL